MSEYTTGDVAKLCNVSIRTVQYYDTRGILVPSKLTEGGRRIYTDDDLKKMKIICFLRNVDLSINSIHQLFLEEHPERVIALLLEEQEKKLQVDIAEKKAQQHKIEELTQSLKKVEQFSIASIADIAYMMENRKKLRSVHVCMVVIGILIDILEVLTLILWYKTGLWWPFAVAMCIVIVLGAWITLYYFKRTSYICPNCHTVFKPDFKQAFFARHTPSTRKLTCTNCNHHGFCVETYGEKVV